MIFHCGICISLMINDIEHFFHMPVAQLFVFFGRKCLFRSFAHFKSQVCLFFLMLGCMSCLYILDIKLLSVISFTNIFSHSIGCLFALLKVSLL